MAWSQLLSLAKQSSIDAVQGGLDIVQGSTVAVVVEVDGVYPAPTAGFATYNYIGVDDPADQTDPALPIPDGSEWLELV